MSVVLRQFARNCLHCCKHFHKLYESSGDAEAYGIYSLLACVPSSYLLSEVCSALALLNLFMQKKIADFSKLPFILKSTLDIKIPSGRVMPVCVLQLRQPYQT